MLQGDQRLETSVSGFPSGRGRATIEAMIDSFSAEEVSSFDRDGFLIIEQDFISEETVMMLRERFDELFSGQYATGIAPDEVNWVRGRDPETKTRQICNGWKADDLIAARS